MPKLALPSNVIGGMVLTFASGVMTITAFTYWLRSNQIFWLYGMVAVIMCVSAISVAKRVPK